MVNDDKPEQINTNAMKLDGFVSPDANQTIDQFAKNEGSHEVKNSYGLTNSMGGLRLSAEQIELLRTRGGNKTEVPGSMTEI